MTRRMFFLFFFLEFFIPSLKIFLLILLFGGLFSVLFSDLAHEKIFIRCSFILPTYLLKNVFESRSSTTRTFKYVRKYRSSNEIYYKIFLQSEPSVLFYHIITIIFDIGRTSHLYYFISEKKKILDRNLRM